MVADDPLHAPAELVAAAEQHVKQQLEQQAVDSSHDYWHIHRVRQMSLRIAAQEHVSDGLHRSVELCALLHDLADWKYSGCSKAGPEAVEVFLTQHNAAVELTKLVLYVVRSVGFKDSLDTGSLPSAPCPEAVAVLRCVCDADRLDAIGAI